MDWYQQHADDCDDEALKAILIHNMKEEIGYAVKARQWLRRNDETFVKELKERLFKDVPPTGEPNCRRSVRAYNTD